MNRERNSPSQYDARLDEAVAEYIFEFQAGHPPERSAFLARHPDLADDLALFLEDHRRFGQLLSPECAANLSPLATIPATCPHCFSPLASTTTKAACPGCGARFRLDDEAGQMPDQGRVGRFVLVAIAGRGAFGTVYKAWDPAMERDIAVKVPRRGTLTDASDLDRFFREARFAATLHHPGIVRIHEVGNADGLPYLVSEFVQGPTLADLLEERRISPDQSAELLTAVAEALHYAHEHGVVHRDVKPSNI